MSNTPAGPANNHTQGSTAPERETNKHTVAPRNGAQEESLHGGSSDSKGSGSGYYERKQELKVFDGKRVDDILISSGMLGYLENQRCGTPKCGVKQLTRGTDLTIINWILQIESFFLVASCPPSTYVDEIVQRIFPKYFDQITPHIRLPYTMFRKKLFKIFGKADRSRVRQSQLATAVQGPEENVCEFINRV